MDLKNFIKPIGTVALLVADAMPLLAQCSMCQASLASAENGANMIVGFRQGIALLLGVMGVLGAIGWRIVRRSRVNFVASDSESANQISTVQVSLHAENPAGK